MSSTRPKILIAGVVVLALGAAAFWKLGSREELPPPSSPILVIGADGLEWNLVLPLLRLGRMPHLERLMERGRYGYLQSMVPTFSPVLWTTVATGKTPDRHGIENFTKRDPVTQEQSLFDRRDRKTKALWNIFSDFDKRVHSIGWWMTFPAERIRGVMVSQTNTLDQANITGGLNVWKGSARLNVPAQVFPRSLEEAVMGVLQNMEDELDQQVDAIFGELPYEHTTLGERLWNNCRWAFRADATYASIANDLAEVEGVPDLTLLYFGGTDVVGHRFWRYMQPELFDRRPPAQQLENFGNVIWDYYAYFDACLGRILELYGRDVNVFVISDHGMGPVNLGGDFDEDDPPDVVNSGNHQEGPPGVFVAAGPDLAVDAGLPRAREARPVDLPTVGSLLDIAPTICAMQRIPLGRDMQGAVLEDLFVVGLSIAAQPEPVATHDDAGFRASQKIVFQEPRADEEERIDQLKQLGYLSPSDE